MSHHEECKILPDSVPAFSSFECITSKLPVWCHPTLIISHGPPTKHKKKPPIPHPSILVESFVTSCIHYNNSLLFVPHPQTPTGVCHTQLMAPTGSPLAPSQAMHQILTPPAQLNHHIGPFSSTLSLKIS